MEQKPFVSLIISFYKNVEFLIPVLISIEQQSFRDFEVIISDDGSPLEVVKEVDKLLSSFSFDYQHIWLEKLGFRKTIMLNKSVVASKSDYLVFIDGDCILHPRFLHEHYHGRKKSFVRTGRRLLLSEKVTGRITPEMIRSGNFASRIIREMFRENIKTGFRAIEQGVYIRSRFMRIFLDSSDRGILGCNFSMFKEDLLSLNGFDERFHKAGVGEDSDLQARIRRTGNIFISSITKRAIVYHQYHELLPREPDIYDIYHKNNAEGITFTPFGIIKKGKDSNKLT